MPIVAYHNSWPYFGCVSGWMLSVYRDGPGVLPSPSYLRRSCGLRSRGACIVVREPHEPERDVAFVASKTGAKVVTLAASVGALPRAVDYISLFDVNVEALTSTAAKR
jgi:hypothetical protein